MLFNNILPPELQFINDTINGIGIRKIIMAAFRRFDRDKLAELVDAIKALGFWGATISGLSLAISDNKILPNKPAMIARGQDVVRPGQREGPS